MNTNMNRCCHDDKRTSITATDDNDDAAAVVMIQQMGYEFNPTTCIWTAAEFLERIRRVEGKPALLQQLEQPQLQHHQSSTTSSSPRTATMTHSSGGPSTPLMASTTMTQCDSGGSFASSTGCHHVCYKHHIKYLPNDDSVLLNSHENSSECSSASAAPTTATTKTMTLDAMTSLTSPRHCCDHQQHPEDILLDDTSALDRFYPRRNDDDAVVSTVTKGNGATNTSYSPFSTTPLICSTHMHNTTVSSSTQNQPRYTNASTSTTSSTTTANVIHVGKNRRPAQQLTPPLTSWWENGGGPPLRSLRENDDDDDSLMDDDCMNENRDAASVYHVANNSTNTELTTTATATLDAVLMESTQDPTNKENRRPHWYSYNHLNHPNMPVEVDLHRKKLSARKSHSLPAASSLVASSISDNGTANDISHTMTNSPPSDVTDSRKIILCALFEECDCDFLSLPSDAHDEVGARNNTDPATIRQLWQTYVLDRMGALKSGRNSLASETQCRIMADLISVCNLDSLVLPDGTYANIALKYCVHRDTIIKYWNRYRYGKNRARPRNRYAANVERVTNRLSPKQHAMGRLFQLRLLRSISVLQHESCSRNKNLILPFNASNVGFGTDSRQLILGALFERCDLDTLRLPSKAYVEVGVQCDTDSVAMQQLWKEYVLDHAGGLHIIEGLPSAVRHRIFADMLTTCHLGSLVVPRGTYSYLGSRYITSADAVRYLWMRYRRSRGLISSSSMRSRAPQSLDAPPLHNENNTDHLLSRTLHRDLFRPNSNGATKCNEVWRFRLVWNPTSRGSVPAPASSSSSGSAPTPHDLRHGKVLHTVNTEDGDKSQIMYRYSLASATPTLLSTPYDDEIFNGDYEMMRDDSDTDAPLLRHKSVTTSTACVALKPRMKPPRPTSPPLRRVHRQRRQRGKSHIHPVTCTSFGDM